jgi:cysteine desulfurase
MIYLDCAASTFIDPQVAETISHVMLEYPANPASVHGLGEQAAQLVQAARAQIATSLGLFPEELIFTSGGTESNNLAIKGVAAAHRDKGKHLLVTAADHPSVLACAQQLAASEGFSVTVVPVNQQGVVDPDQLERSITTETILVSMVHANSETGAIQPVAEIGRRLKNYRQLSFHVDASQTLGKLDVQSLLPVIDLLTVSAHKWHGPKGVGLLIRRNGVRLQPLFCGGNQQQGYRSGTENVPLIAGMARALRLHGTYDATKTEWLYRLRQLLIDEIVHIPRVQLTGALEQSEMAPHIVHVCLQGFRAEVVVRALSAKQIYVSSQSACSERRSAPSAFLLAMGKTESEARAGLRISFDHSLTDSQIVDFCRQLQQTLTQIAY